MILTAARRELNDILYERVMAKVHFIPECGCWIFTGAHNGHGHGQVAYRKDGRLVKDYAYRITYRKHNGIEVPTKYVIRHKCDTPPCVCPFHQLLGTQQQNVLDMFARGRNNPVSLLNLRRGARGCYGADNRRAT